MSLCLCFGAAIASGPASAPAPARPAVLYTKDKAPAAPKLEDLPLKESVSKSGITWTFEKPVPVGQFLTGDWYVVGPVTVKMIDPKPLFGEEIKTPLTEQGDTKESLYQGLIARNGSMLNMPAVVPPSKYSKRTSLAGFDSRLPMGQYDPSQFTKLPIAMKPGDSLVSSISDEPVKAGGYPVKALAVLTCVEAPQPADAFRPSFVKTASCKPYLARNLRRDLLLNLPRPASAGKVKPSDFAHHFSQTLWVDTVGFGRAMPRISFPFVGAIIADYTGGGSLLLLLDYPPEEKEPLLQAMVQVGIDLYGIVRGGGGWPAEGICGSGRKWMIVLAGLMLDDPEMAAVHKTYPDAEFQEDEQVAFLPMEHLGKKVEKTWLGAKVFWTGHYGIRHGQWLDKWAAGWGPTDLYPPSEWPSPWPRGESDRRGTSSPHWVSEALAARLMHAEKVWGHDAFFAYVDRWMTEDDTKTIDAIKKNWDEKLAAPGLTAADELKLQKADRAKWNPVRQGTAEGPSELLPLIKELWAKYRNDLPPGPDGVKTPKAEETWK